MANAPGYIRRRGTSWNVVIRVDGERHEFGPRSEPFLGHSSTTRKDVEEWVWRKHDELREAAKREARRDALGEPEAMTFSELVERFREEVLPTLAKGTQRSYEETFGPAEEFFVDRLGDPLL